MFRSVKEGFLVHAEASLGDQLRPPGCEDQEDRGLNRALVCRREIA
jgi:hypothetical protein